LLPEKTARIASIVYKTQLFDGGENKLELKLGRRIKTANTKKFN
jgi:hypothetical protein